MLESEGSQRKDHFVNLKRMRDHHMAHTHSERAPSIHYGSHETSHNSRDGEVHNLEKKVEQLRQRLHHKTPIREDRTPTLEQDSSSQSDGSYRPQSRTPPSESFTSSSHRTSRRKHYRREHPQGKARGMMPWERLFSRYPTPLFLGIKVGQALTSLQSAHFYHL